MRKTAVALVVTLLASLGALVPAAVASDTASSPKVVIIVGATHAATSNYRSSADTYYAEALKYTPNVVRVYSPNATWARVKAEIEGASIVIYLGHGNGFPSPYSTSPRPTSQNGFGLNATANNGDHNNVYYGEYYIKDLNLAGAVILLNRLCYASGNSEPGHAEPTLTVAKLRVDNYAAGFLAAGARAVIADGIGDLRPYIRDLLTTSKPVDEIWRTAPNHNGNDFTFESSRTPGAVARMDPKTSTSGFYRSIVGALSTDSHPGSFVVPGAAEAAAGTTVYGAPSLAAAPVATLPPQTPLRLTQSVTADTTSTMFQVTTLDGSVSGYVAAETVVPRDSYKPAFWGITSPTAFSPNGDGVNDTLALQARLSETAAWRVRISSGSSVLVEGTGTGDRPALTWDGRAGGKVVADGAYRWRIEATDLWGNGPLVAEGNVYVDTRPDSRLAGSDRYATAAAISAASFTPGVGVAYVATGANFPDALAGAAVAGKLAAPVLLVTQSAIPAATAAELGRLKPGRIVVLGSTAVIGGAVETALASYTTGGVTRLAGSDRYATAASISAASFDPGVPVAYVATGANFPDALAGAAVAGKQAAPVLLVTKDSIPDATAAELARLTPGRIVVLGSAGVVSDAVRAALGAYTAGGVTRLAGSDRYATAAAISAASFTAPVAVAYVATGANFPDALAGAAVAGKLSSPVLLVTRDAIPAATAAELKRLRPARIVVLGSAGVISENVRYALLQFEVR